MLTLAHSLLVKIKTIFWRLAFIIFLHKDDYKVLEKIQSFLNVGKIYFSGKFAYYRIIKKGDILNVLIPFIDKYQLKTSKWLVYQDFKTIFLYYQNLPKGHRNLKGDALVLFNTLFNQKNLKRTDLSKIPDVVVDKFWFLGFLEGESSFSLLTRNMNPSFYIDQHFKNKYTIEKILLFLEN